MLRAIPLSHPHPCVRVGILLMSGFFACGEDLLKLYLYISVGAQAVLLLHSLLLLFTASCAAKWGVPSVALGILCRLRLYLSVMNFGISIMGLVVLALKGSSGCGVATTAATCLVAFSMLQGLLELGCTRCCYNSQGDQCGDINKEGWHLLCKGFLCFSLWSCCSDADFEDEDVYGPATETVAKVTGGIPGFTMSDMARALHLVYKVQRYQVSERGFAFDIPEVSTVRTGGSIGTISEEQKAGTEQKEPTPLTEQPTEVKDGETGAGLVTIEIKEDSKQSDVTQNDKGKTQPGRITSEQMEIRAKVARFEQPELTADDNQRLQQAHHFFKFAEGSMGWPIYSLVRGPCRSCWLCGACCMTLPSENDQHLDYRACCGCRADLPAMAAFAGVATEDVIMGNMSADIDRVVYYVVRDRETQSLVVTIRGTMSAQDCLTDGRQRLASYRIPKRLAVTMTGERKSPDTQAPVGFLRASERIIREIKAAEHVVKLIKSGEIKNIVTTGHSLGGAISSILPVLMLNESLFENVRVRGFPFAPPPVFERALATCDGMKELLTATVYADDMVPRISIFTVHKTRKMALACVRTAKGRTVRGLAKRGFSAEELKALAAEFESDACIPTEKDDPNAVVPLHVGGAIYHFKSRVSASPPTCFRCRQVGCCLCAGALVPVGSLDVVVYRASSEAFQDMKVSKDMTHDHLPNFYRDALDNFFAMRNA